MYKRQVQGDERTVATQIGVNPFFVKDYIQASRHYGYPGVEKILLLLHQYNLKSVGVGSGSADAGSCLLYTSRCV